jgi:hypothetical protein
MDDENVGHRVLDQLHDTATVDDLIDAVCVARGESGRLPKDEPLLRVISAYIDLVGELAEVLAVASDAHIVDGIQPITCKPQKLDIARDLIGPYEAAVIWISISSLVEDIHRLLASYDAGSLADLYPELGKEIRRQTIERLEGAMVYFDELPRKGQDILALTDCTLGPHVPDEELINWRERLTIIDKEIEDTKAQLAKEFASRRAWLRAKSKVALAWIWSKTKEQGKSIVQSTITNAILFFLGVGLTLLVVWLKKIGL